VLLFTIEGNPVPQKQTLFVRATGIAYDPSRKDREKIQWQIKPFAPQEPLLDPLEMHITFFLPIPKSTSKRMYAQMLNGVILPKKKPDVDNLAYIVTNAFKEIVYKDDSQITDLILRKRYSDRPRTVVQIIPLDELQPVGGARCA